MSGSSSIGAAVLAFVVAFASFSVLSVWSPAGSPIDAVWDHELIRDIVFEGRDYRSLDNVKARLVYQNPSDSVVSFNLTYPVIFEVLLDGERQNRGGSGAEGDWEIVAVPPGGEYTVCNAGFHAQGVGWYEIVWGDARRGIEVTVGEIVPRLVTNKESYRAGEFGNVALEYYNPTGHNVTIIPPTPVEFYTEYQGQRAEFSKVIFYSWIKGNFTVLPGESFRVDSYSFTAPSSGKMTLVVNNLRKTISVQP